MKVILIDDEPLALRDLERQIGKFDGLRIVACYDDPAKAIADLPLTRPNVVFIDIEMPNLNGLEAAEQILQFDSAIEIIFVTAYEEYAVKAFELNALDYLLKPLNTARLARTVERILKETRPSGPPLSSDPIIIRNFNQLTIERGNAEPFHWRTAKARELFAYLVYRRQQPVRKDVLLEMLWPYMDTKKAFSLLYTTTYQLRKAFESAGYPFLIKSSGDGYVIHLGNAVIEAEEWENRLAAAPELSDSTLSLHMNLLDMYRGDYLAEHDYPWAEIEKNRLRTLWYQHALRLAQYLRNHRRLLDAAGVHLKIQKLYPFNEYNDWTLIQIYAELGDRAAVEQHYRQFVAMLKESLGTTPTGEMQKWYEQWINRDAR